MGLRSNFIVLAVALVGTVGPTEALAQPKQTGECTATVIARASVATCVVRASAALRVDRQEVEAAVGRRVAAAPWFPNNPTIAIFGSRRAGTEGRDGAYNYGASLSQEIEVAGARSSRRRAADAETDARRDDVVATSRRAAADGYVAYFDLIASRDAVEVAKRLETIAQQIARVTKGRADAGVASGLDAEITDAASLRVTQARLAADRDFRVRSARLASLLGRDPIKEQTSLTADGSLEPLRGIDGIANSAKSRGIELAKQHPEVRAITKERQAFEARAQAYRRARVPSLTLQLFAQNDGYNERVFGAGLALPITLPQPVGHSYTGQIRENEALALKATARSERLEREINLDLATALANFDARTAEAALFTRERVDRAEKILSEIGREIESGRLPVRDALLAEQQLIDVLRGFVEARRSLCIASVDLALAAGVALESEPR